MDEFGEGFHVMGFELNPGIIHISEVMSGGLGSLKDYRVWFLNTLAILGDTHCVNPWHICVFAFNTFLLLEISGGEAEGPVDCKSVLV